MKAKIIKVDFTPRGKSLREMIKTRQREKNYKRTEDKIRRIVNN